MRIAIDARAAAEVPAGRGRYVRELLRGLSRLETEHEYLLYARKPWFQGGLGPAFEWVTFDAPGPSWPLLAGARMSREADVALACTSYAMTISWRRVHGASIVWDLTPFDRSLRTPQGSLLERLTLPIAARTCAAMIAISETTRRDLAQRFPMTARKTAVAYPAADPRFSPVPEPDDRDVLARHALQPPYVLMTGTLEPRKNLPRLIEAFAGLDERLRRGWTLVLVGASGWETDATFTSVTAYSDLVRTLGFVTDGELTSLYRQAELFCYVSLYEGFGIPVLEAMQSGVPVLTSSLSSLPEVGGQAARYADPYSVPAIRAGLAELIADRDLRARCAESGLERARAFSWDATARRLLATLESLESLAP